MIRTVGLRGVAAGAVLALLLPVDAKAGKFCGDRVEGGASSGATQEEALVAAQKWWSSRAGSLGRGYDSWDTADDREFECSKEDKGGFRCKAAGRPCLPDGVLPENVPKIDM